MTEAFVVGFMEKCAELGVDPETLAKQSQALSSAVRAIAPITDNLSRIGSATTLGNAASGEAVGGVIPQAQAIADNAFAGADIGSVAARTAGSVVPKTIAPAAGATLGGIGKGLGRIAGPLWAAGYGVDAVHGLANPQQAYEDTEKATSGTGIAGGLQTALHGFSRPFSAMGSTVNAAIGLGKAKMDQAAAQRSSQWSADQLAKPGLPKRYATPAIKQSSGNNARDIKELPMDPVKVAYTQGFTSVCGRRGMDPVTVTKTAQETLDKYFGGSEGSATNEINGAADTGMLAGAGGAAAGGILGARAGLKGAGSPLAKLVRVLLLSAGGGLAGGAAGFTAGALVGGDKGAYKDIPSKLPPQ